MEFLGALIFTITSLVWGFLTVKYMDDPMVLILLTVVYIGIAITFITKTTNNH